jgi:protein SCO1
MKLGAKNLIRSCIVIVLILMNSNGTSSSWAHDDSAKTPDTKTNHSTRNATKEAFPGAAKYEPVAAYKYSQAAIGKTVGNYKFINSNGRAINLDQYRGKPLILSMIFSSCAHICPMLTQNLAGAVDEARDALGTNDFNVISVGFDTLRDTPRAMKSFARQQGVGDENWHVLSGKPDEVERLSSDTGFIYFKSVQGFDHLTQTTLINAKGEVYAQVYGQDFEPPRLTEPLKKLLLGKAKSLDSFDALVNQVKLFCTVYDPYTGKYKFDYSFFIGMFLSAIVLLLMGNFVIRNVWRIWYEAPTELTQKSDHPVT